VAGGPPALHNSGDKLQKIKIHHSRLGSRWSGESGQALAEMTIGLIVLAVLFLGILLIGDLGRARLGAILDSRAQAGSLALAGIKSGTPIFFGASDSQERLKTEILDATEHPITYSQYTSPGYPYMLENVVAPVYNPSGGIIDAFHLTYVQETRYVANMPFLYNMQVGPSTIPISQQTCLSVMKDFP